VETTIKADRFIIEGGFVVFQKENPSFEENSLSPEYENIAAYSDILYVLKN